MALRYTGPDLTWPSLVTAVDADDVPVQWSPFTLTAGDVVDVAVNPDDRVFAEVEDAPTKAADNAAPTEPPTPDLPPAIAALPKLKADLITVASDLGLDTTGTVADLTDWITAHTADPAVTPTDPATPADPPVVAPDPAVDPTPVADPAPADEPPAAVVPSDQPAPPVDATPTE